MARGEPGLSRSSGWRVFLLLLAFAAGASFFLTEASAQNSKATFIKPGTGGNNNTTSPASLFNTLTTQSFTITNSQATYDWNVSRILACAKTSTPTSTAASYVSSGCTEIANRPSATGAITVNVTVTQAMVDNGGVVIVVQDPGGFFGDDVIYGKWVPLVTPPGIVTSPSTTTTSRVRTSEDGSTATVDVKLATQPTGNVVLAVASSNTAQGTVSPSSLTFTTTNWSTAQTVTLTGVDDNPDAADGGQNYTATLTVNQASTADSNYDALSAVTIYAVNLDDELGLDVGAVSGSATEAGGTATFTVKLVTDPALVFDSSESVTVAVSSRDAGEGTVSPPSLTFTAGSSGTWNTAQMVTVTGVDDDVDDGDVSWDVRLDTSSADGSDYDAVPDVDVSVTTSDDEAAPSVTLSVNPTSVSENGGASTVTATLSGKSSAATTVTVTPVSGAYTVGSGAAATIVIPAGATTSTDTATVTAVNNTTDEPNRTPTVTATVANARATADSTTMAVTGATLILTDDDAAPGVTLSLNPGSVSENGGTSTVSATLSHPSSQPTTVTITAVSGAFTVPSGAAGRIVIPAGATTASADTVTITAVDNTTDEPNRMATVTAAVANTQGAGSVTGATLTLTDNDAAPGVTLSLNPASVSENSGTSTVSATLSHPSSQATTVTITAVSGAFTVPSGAAGRIVIPAGATTASADTVTITAVDNTTDEPSRMATVTATVANTQGAGSVTGATLTLTDNDAAPEVTLSLNPASVSENSGTSTVSATLSHPSSQATTVTITAVSGAFTVPSGAAGRIVIPAGATTASADTVTITAVDNTTDEPSRMATVTATVANTQGAGSVTSATLTLTDNDAAPGVTLSLNPASIWENGASSTVTATLSHPSSEATTVTVTPVAGAFTAPAGTGRQIVFAAGATTSSHSVGITSVDNNVDEPDRQATVTATVANTQGAGSVTSATLTLRDNETSPTVTLSVSPTSISEDGGTAAVGATLSHPSSEATTVTVTPVSGAYSVGADATIVIAAGATTAPGDTADITAVDNDVDAADNPVTVTGAPTNSHGVGALTGASLTITDDDVAAIVTSPSTTTTSRVRTSEDGSTATVNVTLATKPTGDVVLAVASTDTAQGTASPAMLTFTATDWNTAQTVTLTGVDDNPGTADGSQNYTVTLAVNQASTADANYDALSAVTIYAVNADDELGLDVGTVSGPATEAGGTATFTVKLVTDPALATQASQTVTVAVSSRDAGEGRVSPSSLTFTAGASGTWSTDQTVTVTGVDDDVDDGDVVWDVRLDTSSANGSDYDAVPDVDVSVTTSDDDAAPSVTLSVNPGSVSENGGTATVTARLSRASGAATTLTVTGVSGLYTPGSDATIVIPAGATTSTDTATITAVDDNVHQGSAGRQATVTATVANARAAADSTTMAVTGAALTLTDDEAALGATLSLNPATVDETGAGNTSTVSATLSHASAAATTVTITGVSGFYTVGSDATIVIPAGDTTAASDTATIIAVDNTTDEPDRTATVTGTLSNAGGAGSVTGATLTITDDDAAPTVALSVSPASISEDGGTAAVGAALSHPSSEATTVTVTAVSGAYTVGSGAAGTIVVPAGAATSTDTATIIAVDNDVDAADNPVTVTGTPTNSHGVGALTGVSLTITDDDVAGIVTSPETSAASRVRTSEDGSTAAVDVTLATRPTGNVVLDVASTDTAQGTVSPAMLTFTPTNWSTAQRVTLTGVDDAPPGAPDGSQNYTVTLTVNTADTADANYDALSAAVIHARNLDDEAGVEVSPTSGLVTGEGGGSATFTVKLLSEPEGDVTVPLASSDPGEGAVSPASLTFTTGSWDTPQTVTVTGVDDDADDGDEPYRIETGDPSSTDAAAYDGLEAGDVDDVSVVNTDDDATPTVTLALDPATVSEDGGVATVTATLSHPSDEATTVTVPPVAGAFTVDADAALIIEAGEIGSTGAVTLTAVDNDVDAPDAEVTVAGAAANDRAAADSAVMAVTAATLTIVDDDERGFVFAGAGDGPAPGEEPLVAEAGGEVRYTVALGSEPTGPVTVEVESDNEDVSASPARLAFTADDWDTAQTVTVAARRDGDAFADAAVLTHRARGGGYGALETGHTVAVAVADPAATRIGAPEDPAPMAERTYVVGSQAVTLTWEAPGTREVVQVRPLPDRAPGALATIELLAGKVEVRPPRRLASPLALTFRALPAGEVPPGSGGYRPGRADEARTAVDVEADRALPEAEGGLERFCLEVTPGLLGEAEAAQGREPLLLHHVGDEWTEVEGGSAWEREEMLVCAGAPVADFSDFAAGYVDTRPVFDAAGFPKEYVWDEDEPITPVDLPAATGGDGTLTYVLAPALPPGVERDGRRLSGTPTGEFTRTGYTWTATDADGDETKEAWTFDIEVVPARDLARARLKRINESILPEVSRASWDSAMGAVTGRLESSSGGGGASGASGGGLAASLAGFVQANGQALEDDASWKEMLSGRSFAAALGGGGDDGDGGAGPGTGWGRSVTVWGAGDRRRLSRDERSLKWSGDLSAFHLGADAAFGSGLTGGLGVSWFESRMDYVDRSDDEPIEGVHRSRMASVQPYVGWSSARGSRLWASVGYGAGEIEIDDEALLERHGRQRSDSRLVAAAAGGAVRLALDGATRVDLKGEGQATRYTVDDNGPGKDDLIAGLTVETQRLRVTAQGSREYVLAGGGRLSPSVEFGVRWDGGDGATGTGGEFGGGLSWTGPGRLALEVGGRWLVAHRSGMEEWGLSGGLRLDPRANGRGLSLRVAPGWGEAGSGVSRLWEEGVAGRGETAGRRSGAVLQAEAGYGVGAFGGFGVATPYTRFGQSREERRFGVGWRLTRGTAEAFALDLEAYRRERGATRPEHGVGLDLRLSW